jgi:hypothetical protein
VCWRGHNRSGKFVGEGKVHLPLHTVTAFQYYAPINLALNQLGDQAGFEEEMFLAPIFVETKILRKSSSNRFNMLCRKPTIYLSSEVLYRY